MFKNLIFDFRAVIKRCVLAEGVACGTDAALSKYYW